MVLGGVAAWIGLVVGHVGAYALAYPSAGDRHAHLLLTGHGWMGPAMLSLGAAIPAVLAVAAVRAARGGPMPVRLTAARLAGAQVLAFLFVEVAERHTDVAAALSDPAVLTGVVVQIVVGVVLAVALSGWTRAVDTVIRRSRLSPTGDRASSDPVPVLDIPVRPALRAPTRRRAPPLVAVP
jgi:hypothetical protein